MSWLLLLLAGLFEVGFTTCLKLSDGFTRLWPTLGFVVFAAISFWLLTRATATIPLGTAYAVWTGIGALGTVIVGIVAFGDPAGTLRMLFLLLLIASIIGLKLVS
ncbi:QacE family quaternary ammonium compound efflux SMR transporter [Pseudomethylobacillus aquaticus]|uniref:Guanidinium exporter n=1 Tax=Pseudomethylobacillus aquaticus TaxID=2676064 RepID=A0A3N0V684_9PROT|nr:multidrug efflux SMR transporter [Pseudomethylobacillus aquaticus]ROH88223.1 QacE family quaternary ammonium compound efflux SMR transporter [Pseudomethylobacillus aquaticus]